MSEKNKNDIHRYDDIIALPHHVSKKRAQMPQRDRAAQFSPFAALSGYGAAISETARLTESRAELDECSKAELDSRLRLLKSRMSEAHSVEITYFKADARKSGGEYVTASGTVAKIDEYDRAIVMTGGTRVPIDDIRAIEGGLFRDFEPWG